MQSGCLSCLNRCNEINMITSFQRLLCLATIEPGVKGIMQKMRYLNYLKSHFLGKVASMQHGALKKYEQPGMSMHRSADMGRERIWRSGMFALPALLGENTFSSLMHSILGNNNEHMGRFWVMCTWLPSRPLFGFLFKSKASSLYCSRFMLPA